MADPAITQFSGPSQFNRWSVDIDDGTKIFFGPTSSKDRTWYEEGTPNKFWFVTVLHSSVGDKAWTYIVQNEADFEETGEEFIKKLLSGPTYTLFSYWGELTQTLEESRGWYKFL